MMSRFVLASLALTTFATVSEAGPFRRRAQPVYQAPSLSPPIVYSPSPATDYAALYSAASTLISAVTSSEPGGDGLEEVNAKRAAHGLSPFIRDEGLTRAARSCAAFRAEHRLFGHTSNDFGFLPAGASASSAGCAAYPVEYGWMSCCVYDGYTYAGAAYVTGRDGRRYMHLFVR